MGLTDEIPAEMEAAAAEEGWIALPKAGSLAGLANDF